MSRSHSIGFFLLLILLIPAAVIISGCNNDDAVKVSLSDKDQAQAGVDIVGEPASSANIQIAVSGMTSPDETLVYYKEMLDYIGAKLGAHVDLVQRETYDEVNELVKEEQLQMAFVCTGAYVECEEECNMELLAAPKVYGETVYYSYIIVPSDSSAESLEDLRGKEFAFTDPKSNTGKLAPTYTLSQMNETPDTFFKKYIFTYSHNRSIEAVGAHVIDGAAVDSLIWDYLDATNPDVTSGTRIISRSAPFGIPPVVVPGNLDPELKARMKEILLNMDEDPEGMEILRKIMIDEFVELDDSAYNSVREMMKWVDDNE